MKAIYLFAVFIALFTSCNRNKKESDAYGNFEATEIMVSSEATGKILNLKVDEGSELKEGQVIGVIDTIQLHLKAEQLIASKKAIASRNGNIASQMNVLLEQKKILSKEQQRFERLAKGNVIPQKQLDDINGQLSVLDQQIKSIDSQHSPVISEIRAMDAQLGQVQDQISRSIIKSPIQGTVLNKYSEQGELTAVGKPIFKIADLQNMILRVFVSGSQLSQFKIGEQVTVLFDKDKDENSSIPGRITWVSANAEFTPKTIQTKEDRVNMVYAVKIAVKNNGEIKIGMPGEIRLKSNKAE